jgi:hypothetical protein
MNFSNIKAKVNLRNYSTSKDQGKYFHSVHQPQNFSKQELKHLIKQFLENVKVGGGK